MQRNVQPATDKTSFYFDVDDYFHGQTMRNGPERRDLKPIQTHKHTYTHAHIHYY